MRFAQFAVVLVTACALALTSSAMFPGGKFKMGGKLDQMLGIAPFPRACRSPGKLMEGVTHNCVHHIQSQVNSAAGVMKIMPDGVWSAPLTALVRDTLLARGLDIFVPEPGQPLSDDAIRSLFPDFPLTTVYKFMAKMDPADRAPLVELVKVMVRKVGTDAGSLSALGKPQLGAGACGPQDDVLVNMMVPDAWTFGSTKRKVVFSTACQAHDSCYAAGPAHSDAARAACDAAFETALTGACEAVLGATTGSEDARNCGLVARVYALVVRQHGGRMFGPDGSLRKVEEGDVMPHIDEVRTVGLEEALYGEL